MLLSTQSLPQYFTIATPANSHYTQETNCFDFVSRNSKNLLVTVGESWVWGAGLRNRLHETFGNVVSDFFGWDWLNLGQPGASNFYIAERVEELANIIAKLDYDHVTTLCVFTEVGRGFNSHHDKNLDYRTWLDSNISKQDDFDNFLNFLNRHCVDRILSALDNRSRVVFGSNFVNHLGLPMYCTLPRPWFELLGNACEPNCYAGTTGTKRLAQLHQFLDPDKQNLFKSWFINLIARAEQIDKVERASSLGFDRMHPDAEGHKLWANYVIDYLTHARQA